MRCSALAVCPGPHPAGGRGLHPEGLWARCLRVRFGVPWRFGGSGGSYTHLYRGLWTREARPWQSSIHGEAAAACEVGEGGLAGAPPAGHSLAPPGGVGVGAGWARASREGKGSEATGRKRFVEFSSSLMFLARSAWACWRVTRSQGHHQILGTVGNSAGGGPGGRCVHPRRRLLGAGTEPGWRAPGVAVQGGVGVGGGRGRREPGLWGSAGASAAGRPRPGDPCALSPDRHRGCVLLAAASPAPHRALAGGGAQYVFVGRRSRDSVERDAGV